MINHPNRKRRTIGTTSAKPKPTPRRKPGPHVMTEPPDFHGILDGVQARFRAVSPDAPLFVSDACGLDLNEVYLGALPALRQYHNCSACRAFLKRYGSLAIVDDEGNLAPAMWDPSAASDFYRPAVEKLAAAVRAGRVTGVFMTKEAAWGVGVTYEWEHFAVVPQSRRVHRGVALTAGQAAAVVRENVNTVRNTLVEYPKSAVQQALRLFESEHLQRGDKYVEPVRWLLELHDRPKGMRGENLLWRAVATAPNGFCHTKSSVVGPLLDDVVAGVPFEKLKAKHASKMHPLVHQRPQAPPSAGNVAAAEKLFEKLGLAPALERRFARLDEVEAFWRPAPVRPGSPARGVFGHIETKDRAPAPPPISIPPATMTWEKFARVALRNAERIELLVPSRGTFVALTAPLHADAPPILKWDREDARNPIAWYVYHNGSAADQWMLRGGSWTPVTAVCQFPNQWGDRPMPFIADGVVLVLEGAADVRDAGNALFPECLREDVHGARATIEAYSRRATLAGRAEASACGYDIRKGHAAVDATLRAFDGSGWSSYRIDRWD